MESNCDATAETKHCLGGKLSKDSIKDGKAVDIAGGTIEVSRFCAFFRTLVL